MEIEVLKEVSLQDFKDELEWVRNQIKEINDKITINASTANGININLSIPSFYTEDLLESILFAEQIKAAYYILKDFKYIGYKIKI